MTVVRGFPRMLGPSVVFGLHPPLILLLFEEEPSAFHWSWNFQQAVKTLEAFEIFQEIFQKVSKVSVTMVILILYESKHPLNDKSSASVIPLLKDKLPWIPLIQFSCPSFVLTSILASGRRPTIDSRTGMLPAALSHEVRSGNPYANLSFNV